MNLYELTKNIQSLAYLDHVNFNEAGDVYELNKRMDIKYPAFILSEDTHRYNYSEGVEYYNFNVFFVDRLTENKANELNVKNWANRACVNLVKNITEKMPGAIISTETNINTFTERFESLCAGAFANITLRVDEECVCK